MMPPPSLRACSPGEILTFPLNIFPNQKALLSHGRKKIRKNTQENVSYTESLLFENNNEKFGGKYLGC